MINFIAYYVVLKKAIEATSKEKFLKKIKGSTESSTKKTQLCV